jgi:acetyl-CoA acyltransferase
MKTAVIVDVVRTPSGRGKPGGALSGVHPVDLLSHVLSAVLTRNGLDSRQIDDVLIGCLTQVGEQSTNIARSAVLAAGFDETVPAATIDRQCGSSQQCVAFAAQAVMAGVCDIVIAGGVESMSRVPMGSAAASGDPFGPLLRKRYPERLVSQGVAAELVADRWHLSRDELDAYAAESHRRAAAASAAGAFDAEILPVEVRSDGNATVFVSDETVRPDTSVAKLASLKPAFDSESMRVRFPGIDWKITAGNSSPLTDGASAALIMSEQRANQLGLNPRAALRHFTVVGDDPLLMLTAPIPATQRILKRACLSIDDLDAYEVNEAFASVPLAWAAEVGADPAKLNPRGGAIALGHALGSSGTRLLTTLIHYLEATDGRFGLQTMCEGGGMANALILERLGD